MSKVTFNKQPINFTIDSISDELKRCNIEVEPFDCCHSILAKVVARVNEVASMLKFPTLYPEVDPRILIRDCANLVSLVMTLGVQMDLEFEADFDWERCARKLNVLAVERIGVWAAML